MKNPILHQKIEEKILILRELWAFKKIQDGHKNIKFDNICKSINILDTHKEQRLFLLKKYTFPKNVINIEQIIKKLCPLEKCK